MSLSKAQLLAFDRFRAAYPRRPDNPWSRVKPAFEKALKAGVDPEELIRAAAAYAEQCKALGKDPKFIFYASTFLNKRDYEDFLEEVPASAVPQPSPEHPLAWLVPALGEAAFLSWIEPLQVDLGASPVRIAARTQFVLDRVRRDYGPDIVAILGEVAWVVQPKRPS